MRGSGVLGKVVFEMFVVVKMDAAKGVSSFMIFRSGRM